MKDISDKIMTEQTAEELGISTEELEFQEAHNPLKLYHRLVNVGIQMQDAIKISDWYEETFYKPLMELIDYRKKGYKPEN